MVMLKHLKLHFDEIQSTECVIESARKNELTNHECRLNVDYFSRASTCHRD